LHRFRSVLDIATGPGYIAEAFSKVAREVVGIDLTDAMLQIADPAAKNAKSPISVFVAATSSISPLLTANST